MEFFVAGNHFSSRETVSRHEMEFLVAGNHFSSRETVSRHEMEFLVTRNHFSSRETVSRHAAERWSPLAGSDRRSLLMGAAQAAQPLRPRAAGGAAAAHVQVQRHQDEQRGTCARVLRAHCSGAATAPAMGHGDLSHAISDEDQ
jgi:hypothetical protein